MVRQGCLLLHGPTAASKTHCYIYLRARQVFALILTHPEDGWGMKIRILAWLENNKE